MSNSERISAFLNLKIKRRALGAAILDSAAAIAIGGSE
jgi:hypothetical protein